MAGVKSVDAEGAEEKQGRMQKKTRNILNA
jgi:hypothetical protein